jgi:hypothetical protein
VSLRNATPGRLLGVVSVDGVNVISGETAAWQQTGYVLSPWQQHAVTGWRKSDAEVAAFHFTAAPASYAARPRPPARSRPRAGPSRGGCLGCPKGAPIHYVNGG